MYLRQLLPQENPSAPSGRATECRKRQWANETVNNPSDTAVGLCHKVLDSWVWLVPVKGQQNVRNAPGQGKSNGWEETLTDIYSLRTIPVTQRLVWATKCWTRGFGWYLSGSSQYCSNWLLMCLSVGLWN
ncbi:hypothetical protein XENTR_v10022986 [Xenopus tropicalis]|nr:hypothetical protein XENTR_v10022986 [Xenopus tropicalis]